MEGEHALESEWTCHFSAKQGKSEEWTDAVTKVFSFASVEQLWGGFGRLAKPSALEAGSDYHIFRSAIKPEWEDSANCNGGKWSLSVSTAIGVDVDTCWLTTVLAMAGENFSHNSEVCGAVVSARPQFTRISLWTKTCSEEIVMAIGNAWKQHLSKSCDLKITFMAHSDARKSSAHKTRFQI